MENTWNMEIRNKHNSTNVNFCDDATSRSFRNRAITIETRLGRWTR